MTLTEWIDGGNALPDTLAIEVYGVNFTNIFVNFYKYHTINDSTAYPFSARIDAVASRVIGYYGAKIAAINAIDVSAENSDTREVINYAAPEAVIDPAAPIGSYTDTHTMTDTHYNRALARAEVAKADNLVTALLGEFAVCFANWEDFD